MARGLTESMEIALDFAGLSTDRIGPAHKMIGAKDAHMGMTFAAWWLSLTETEREDTYGQVRSQTVKWFKMRERGSASQDEGSEQSQSDTAGINPSFSQASLTPNSVQSTLSSVTQETPSTANSNTPNVQDKQEGKTKTSRSKGNTQEQ